MNRQLCLALYCRLKLNWKNAVMKLNWQRLSIALYIIEKIPQIKNTHICGPSNFSISSVANNFLLLKALEVTTEIGQEAGRTTNMSPLHK